VNDFVIQNKFHDNYTISALCHALIEGLRERTEYVLQHETEKITRKASDAAEYIELFGSSARDRHARRMMCVVHDNTPSGRTKQHVIIMQVLKSRLQSIRIRRYSLSILTE